LADPGRPAGYRFLGFGRRSIENERDAKKTMANRNHLPDDERRHSYSPAPVRNLGYQPEVYAGDAWQAVTLRTVQIDKDGIPCHERATVGS
jgi:hypothetical protein